MAPNWRKPPRTSCADSAAQRQLSQPAAPSISHYSTGALHSTGQAILLKNTDNIAAMTVGGVNVAPLLFLDSTDNTWVAAGGKSKAVFFGNSDFEKQLAILSTDNAVNNFEFSGAVAGQSPLLWMKGSDTDVGSSFGTKGVGVHSFYTNGASFAKQVEIGHVASPTSFLSLKGAAAAGHPIIQPSGTETNPSIIVQGKGTGGVKINDGAAATKFEVNTTGIGFFGTAPAARGAVALPTGTIQRTTYATSTVTLAQLAGVVMAMIADDRAMGLRS
ncbi:hypothetical protein [Mesorhizobium sp. M0078]|uniref:hypothetical protein n=2 Tax=unclassified Mesorhizobium TaxID=325217 RepID=UPI00333D048D